MRYEIPTIACGSTADLYEDRLFTFGGGYAMISVIEDICVERKKWLTHDELYNLPSVTKIFGRFSILFKQIVLKSANLLPQIFLFVFFLEKLPKYHNMHIKIF